MISLVLFDLDGTLADSAHDLAGAINRLRQAAGMPPLPYQALRRHASGGARALLRAGFGIAPGDPGYDELRARFLADYELNLCRETRLFDGIPELLDGLERRGLRWGIVTNKFDRFTRRVVAGLGLGNAACVVSGDSTPTPKPHPAPLLLACRLAERSPAQTVYVGDDLRDIEAGRAAGIRTLAAGWGYLGDGPPVEAWGADAISATPAEVPGLLGAA